MQFHITFSTFQLAELWLNNFRVNFEMHGEHKIFNIFRDYINKGILRLLGCKTNNITLGSLVNFGFNYGTG